MKVKGQLIKWDKVGEGNYNRTYISKEPFEYEIDGISYFQRWVLKIPKKDGIDDLKQEMNHPKRAVRLWNELNPTHPAVILPSEGGWLAPYLGYTKASDQEIAKTQIEIYRNTRRIIADACGVDNFLLFNGEVVCVDVDAALLANSPTSKRVLREVVEFGDEHSVYKSYWEQYSKNLGMPESVQVTKTLLYLDSQLRATDIQDKHINEKTIKALHEYQINNIPLTPQILNALVDKEKLVSHPPSFFASGSDTKELDSGYDPLNACRLF